MILAILTQSEGRFVLTKFAIAAVLDLLKVNRLKRLLVFQNTARTMTQAPWAAVEVSLFLGAAVSVVLLDVECLHCVPSVVVDWLC